jgi:hypothetical protein
MSIKYYDFFQKERSVNVTREGIYPLTWQETGISNSLLHVLFLKIKKLPFSRTNILHVSSKYFRFQRRVPGPDFSLPLSGAELAFRGKPKHKII